MLRKEIQLAVTFAFLISCAPAFAARGGDFGPGNGGDGLEMTNLRPNDVVVPVPSDLGSTGILEVIGTPGAGQANEGVGVIFCKSDERGEPLEFGCGDMHAYRLNTEISVAPGTYILVYSHTGLFVQVKANQKRVIELQKIEVQKTTRPVSFSVFLDFTNPEMQDLALKVTFADSTNQSDLHSYCDSPASQDRAACQAWSSGNWHALLNRNTRFEADGSASFWLFGPTHQFGGNSRRYVTDPEAGDFVSVLPGVYGIVFTDNQTGEQRTQYGIRAE